MRILILGVDGYLGWSLAQHLVKRGHEIAGVDCGLRRQWVLEMGSQSATPIQEMPERRAAFREHFGRDIQFLNGDIAADSSFVLHVLQRTHPDAIVHFAEMPSAPYSMIDVQHAAFTHRNNLLGTLNLLFAMRDACPDAHLVKLGTMGEFGTPNIDIPEGFFTIEYRGRKDTLPFPRQAGSWYHQTKVHDSNNIAFACKIWGLRSTDVMQGVVYGTRIDDASDDERLLTRFDFDQCFGSAINRFCAQAIIGEPLTLYGSGHQRRGFLPLRDSMQCLTLAIENPPQAPEYRVFNQFEKVYSIVELAEKVQAAAKQIGLSPTIRNLMNPRIEAEEHYYNPDHQRLLDLGYKPTQDMDTEIRSILQDLAKYRGRIEAKKDTLLPNIYWSSHHPKA